jgi:hypothetical protein
MKRTPERQREIIEHNEKCGFFDKPESEHFDNEDIPSNFGMCIYVAVFIIFIVYCFNRDRSNALPLPREEQAQHD